MQRQFSVAAVIVCAMFRMFQTPNATLFSQMSERIFDIRGKCGTKTFFSSKKSL